ncbi:MAG: hypothetical protein U9Q06_01705 [Nanoarchaeota archaeon]|nr:hypothetical protein [Nanoarchaeota archaeon]
MKSLLRDSERKEIEKINSKLHGPEYLASDLKNILSELNSLLSIDDAIIFIDFGGIKKQEFHGHGKFYWKEYSTLVKKYGLEATAKNKLLLIKKVNNQIKNLFVMPIHRKKKIIGTLMIFPKFDTLVKL